MIRENIIAIYKKILKISASASNFIFTFLIYFLGVSTSHILWRLSRKKLSVKGTYWLQSKPLPEKNEDYYEQY